MDPLISALDLPPPPPPSASITGPSALDVGEQGTWTASASGGTPPYSFQWRYQRDCGGGPIEPLGHTGVGGGVTIQAEPCDTWFSAGSGSSYSRSFNGDMTYIVELAVTDSNNDFDVTSKTVTIGTGGTFAFMKAAGNETAATPEHYALEVAYPNPFNPQATIRFALPEEADVELVVYDALGRAVEHLVDGRLESGYHEVVFEAAELPSGLYLYELRAGAFTDTGRMVMAK